MNDLQQEWAVLHPDIERYERLSLLIKLVSVAIGFLGIVYFANAFFTALFISILWLQDAIWKTFQKRLESRIVFIEQALANQQSDKEAFQFYSEWQQNRLGVSGLIKEYLASALKPTVAYPYMILLGIIAIVYILT